MEMVRTVANVIKTSIKKLMPTGDNPSKTQKMSENENDPKEKQYNPEKRDYESDQNQEKSGQKQNSNILEPKNPSE